MIQCKELNKSFDTKDNLFKALKSNLKDLISIKTKEVHKSCEKGQVVSFNPTMLKASDVSKTELDDNFYYVAVNTTGILDSHNDLHVKGIWNKTAKEQQGKNYLVADHDLKLKSVIAKPKDIEMLVMEVSFKSIGKDIEGDTQALVYKIAKDKVNADYKEYLDDNIQSSVRMQYVKIDLALDSDDKEDIKHKELFDTYINEIANKEDFDSINYFWVVKEAKNINESSLVLFGSNNVTGLLNEPLKGTQSNIEPSDDTQKEPEKTVNRRKSIL